MYSSQIRVLTERSGSPLPAIVVRLFNIYDQLNPDGGVHEDPAETVTVQAPPSTQSPFYPFTFRGGPNGAEPGYDIGFGVFHAAFPETGIFFRTGRAPSLPTPPASNAYFDVLLSEEKQQTLAEASAALQAQIVLPMVLQSGDPGDPPKREVDDVQLIESPNGTDRWGLTVTGTDRNVATVGFTLSCDVIPTGATAISDTSAVVDVGIVPGSVTLTFSSSGSFISTIETDVLNAVNGLIAEDVIPTVHRIVSDSVSGAAREAAATNLGIDSGTTFPTLPSDIELSLWFAEIRDTELHFNVALGFVGDLTERLEQLIPAPTPSGGGNCAMTTLMALAPGVLSKSVAYSIRNNLLNDPATASWVDLYYRVSPQLSALLRGDEELRSRALRAATELEAGRPDAAETTVRELISRLRALAPEPWLDALESSLPQLLHSGLVPGNVSGAYG